MPIPRLLLAAVGLSLVVVAGCASEEEQVARHVAEAERYQEEGDLRSALVELQSALNVQPKNADLNEKLAYLLGAMQRPARAAFYFGEAYRLDPTKTDAALAQVPAFYSTDPAAARALIDEVLDRDPQKALAHIRLAELLLLQSSTEEALAAALTATELEPEDVMARRMVGAVHRSRIRETTLTGGTTDPKVYEAALETYRKSAELAADLERQGPWYDQLQIALTYTDWPGHSEEARAAFKKAFALAGEREDRAGQLAVINDARRLAAQERDPEFTRWALESWVEVQPGAVAGWRLIARAAEVDGGSAEDVWKRALEGRPDDIGLHAGYVRHLSGEQRVEDAIAHLDGLAPDVANEPEIGALRVEVHITARDLDAARRSLEQLEREHPNAPVTRLARGRLDLREGRVAAALENLRLLAADVERADVLRQLSVAEALSENVDAAIAAAERSIELQPSTSITPHRVRMQMLARKKDWPGVLRAFREARVRGLSVGPQINKLRIQALYETGRQEVARRILKERLAAGDPPLVLVLLYNHYEATVDPEGNRRQLQAAAVRFPRDFRVQQALVLDDLRKGDGAAALARVEAFDALVGKETMPGMRAQIYWALGREDEAEAAVIQGFKTVPRPARTTRLLVTILSNRGKVDEAIRLLEEAHATGSLGADGLWQLGRLHLSRGQRDLAHQRLEEAYEGAPHLLHIQNDLAYVLADTGQELDRAIELARGVKAGLPEDAAVADTLGYVYLKKGLVEPAVFEFRSAIELARVRGNQVADYHYHLGLALQAMGRTEEARGAFAEALRIEPEHERARQAQAEVAAVGPDAG